MKAKQLRHFFSRPAMFLFFLAGLTGCEPGSSGNPESNPEIHEWKWTGLYSTRSGLRSVLLKKEGSYNLILYSGYSRNGADEIAPIAGKLQALGFNVITTEYRKKDPESREKDYQELLTYNLERPGYRNLILITPARALPDILSSREADPSRITGWIIFKPLDLDPEKINRPEHRSFLSRLRNNIPVLWVESRLPDRDNRRSRLRNMFPGEIQLRTTDPELNRDFQEREDRTGSSFSLANLLKDSFINFLLLQKYRIEWVDAIDAFPAGCYSSDRIEMLTDPKSIFRSSGFAEPDFCPLFLISVHPGELYRAEGLENDSCIYRLSNSRERIHCHRSPPDPTRNR